PEALAAQAGRLADHLDAYPDLGLHDVAWSLITSRATLDHRAVVTAHHPTDAITALRALATGQPDRRVVARQVSDGAGSRSGGVVLVLPGQGSQWAGMGRGLADAFPVFRGALQACESALDPWVDWSLTEVVCGESDQWLKRVDVVQPALFGVMVSLAHLWQSFGLDLVGVVGHSQGEIAAAHLAGALSLEDAAQVVAVRSRLVARLSGRGGMVSVAVSEAQARALVEPWAGQVGVAAVNGPGSVTVSGDDAALDELLGACAAQGVRASRVAVDYAAHSHQVEALRDELLEAVGGVEHHASRVPFWSTVTGAELDTHSLDAAYWYRNLREPVQFEATIRAVADGGHGRGIFVEPSPHPVLTAAVQHTLEHLDVSGMAVGTLRRGDGGSARMVAAVAQAWVHGATVDWRTLSTPSTAYPVDLPTYAFHHDRYWPDVPIPVAEPKTSLLGAAWEPIAMEPPATGGRWAVVDALSAAVTDGPVPEAVVWPVSVELGGDDVAELSHELVLRALGWVQGWLADQRFAESLLVVVTKGAVVVDGDANRGPAAVVAAPVWGLVRSAQSENPGRFVLVDVDDDDQSMATLPAAVQCGEPEVAVRRGRLWSRRLVRVGPSPSSRTSTRPKAAPALPTTPATTDSADDGRLPPGESGFDPEGAVLVTGGTGTLGGLVARHLAEVHGVRSLVLTSRRGRDAPGAATLVAELEALGAEISVVPCDAADRKALAGVIADLPATRPLRGVVHTAGVIDDGVVSALTPDQLDTVWLPKALGAWHLHQLTRDLDLTQFVVFSSTAGWLGAAGQANYAAASVFLDTLMEHRHSLDLPGTSVAWGLWDEPSGQTGHLDGPDLARMRRSGVVPLTIADALDLFDEAVQHPPVVAALRLDLGALRDAARTASPIPTLWHSMVEPVVATRRAAAEPDVAAPASALARRLAGVGESERQGALSEVVRAEVAVVLGYRSPDAVDTRRAFKDLGFDSLTAVDLRNRLAVLTGLTLPTTLVFDHPTVDRLSRELDARLAPAEASADEEALLHLSRLEGLLSSLTPDGAALQDVQAGLRRALARLAGSDPPGDRRIDDELSTADAQEVLDLIDREFGQAAGS
ncbi:MAG: SDR family NAD(P)-dependent oxidoreductase, partial [Acidimicrobiales bacterium]